MNDLILLNVSFPDKETAHQAAYMLLEKKLIACAHITQNESIYHFEGKLNHDQEYTLTAKTFKTALEKVILEVKAIHPFKVPGMYYWSIEAESQYAQWTRESVE